MGFRRPVLGLLLFAAGFAALSWEVLWQLETSLSLGVSALGTALTLAAAMGGLSAGALLMGCLLRPERPRALRLYSRLELCIGLSGCLLLPAFQVLEKLDSWVFGQWPWLAPWLHGLGCGLVLGPPAMAMGATIPVLGLVARRTGTPLSLLYGLNTAGAALGSLVLALALIPALGVEGCVAVIAGVNLTVSALAFALPEPEAEVEAEPVSPPEGSPVWRPAPGPRTPVQQAALVLATGFATFALEVSWFRALRAAFQSNTESFAIMLACVLLALSLGAAAVPWARRRVLPLPAFLAAAGVAVLLATPLVERFDQLPLQGGYLTVLLGRFAFSCLVLGTPIGLLGVALPWVLEEQENPRSWARCYALNTLGAVLGALGAAWFLLPLLGFARTAWLTGGGLVLLAAWLSWPRPLTALALGSAALCVAWATESGVGRQRVVGVPAASSRILCFSEGPDSTLSVVEGPSERALVIDGFVAASQHPVLNHYMEMMGRLPMLLHPHPERALVICFGTGQTANGVRLEQASRLRVVELNREVLSLARWFPSNGSVLSDPTVEATVMDGRAWLRRCGETYDVITLEPMPPTFAGVNALYSREFYELARSRLDSGGVAAQWLPFHLVSPYDACSIAATFQAVFPNSVLWVDPVGFTGILLGQKDAPELGSRWPGFSRDVRRSLTEQEFRRALVLDRAGLARYAALGDVVTDGNQLLAYGAARRLKQRGENPHETNLAIVEWASQDPPPPVFSSRTLICRLRQKPR